MTDLYQALATDAQALAGIQAGLATGQFTTLDQQRPGDSTIDAHPAPAVDAAGIGVWHVFVDQATYTLDTYEDCMRLADMLTDAGYHVFTDAI